MQSRQRLARRGLGTRTAGTGRPRAPRAIAVAALHPLQSSRSWTPVARRVTLAGGFADAIGWERQPILDLVARISSHPGADIPPAEFESIRASLTMLRCMRCHDMRAGTRAAVRSAMVGHGRDEAR